MLIHIKLIKLHVLNNMMRAPLRLEFLQAQRGAFEIHAKLISLSCTNKVLSSGVIAAIYKPYYTRTVRIECSVSNAILMASARVDQS